MLCVFSSIKVLRHVICCFGWLTDQKLDSEDNCYKSLKHGFASVSFVVLEE